MVKILLRELKLYTRKHPLTATECSKGRRQEQKISETFGEQNKMADINLTVLITTITA